MGVLCGIGAFVRYTTKCSHGILLPARQYHVHFTPLSGGISQRSYLTAYRPFKPNTQV